MYIQNSSSFLYSAQDNNGMHAEAKPVEVKSPSVPFLQYFSEKAILVFERLTYEFSPEQKERSRESLSSIGKAAAFASVNGFNTQNERNVVSQYFENFSGVLSDEAIQKMIRTKLDNPNYENREFLEKFAQELGEPLQGINIKV